MQLFFISRAELFWNNTDPLHKSKRGKLVSPLIIPENKTPSRNKVHCSKIQAYYYFQYKCLLAVCGIMFLHLCLQCPQYALSTKRNTIKKFEKDIAMRERQLKKAEKKLQDDALAFEEFLRENDQRSVDALKLLVSSLWPNPSHLFCLFVCF